MTYYLYGFDYADPELRQSYRPAQLHYLEKLAGAGKVVLAGPAPTMAAVRSYSRQPGPM